MAENDELLDGRMELRSEERAFPAELAGDYELVRELGRGGMAVVYLARDRELRREVAVKIVQAQYVANAEVLARFAREARTVAGLDHPNIVTLYAVRRLADGSLALVMQYVPGETLQQALARDGAFSFGRARQVLADVAHALGYAHSRGIVHRDVKPENVFLDLRTGRAMLSDFGIARSGELDPRVTRTNVAIGTPAYMSPEQIDGGAVDGRSDLYSLGLVGWEMIAGQQPWEGEGLYGVIYRQKHDELPPLNEVRLETPSELVAAVEGALEKNPQVRWAHADDFLDVLTGRVTAAPRRRRRSSPPGGARPVPALPAGFAASPTLVWRRDENGVAIPASDELPAAADDAVADEAVLPPRRPHFIPPPVAPRRRGRRGLLLGGLLAGAAVAAGAYFATPAAELERRRPPAVVTRDGPPSQPIQLRPESAGGMIVVTPPTPLPAAPTSQLAEASPESVAVVAATPAASPGADSAVPLGPRLPTGSQLPSLALSDSARVTPPTPTLAAPLPAINTAAESSATTPGSAAGASPGSLPGSSYTAAASDSAAGGDAANAVLVSRSPAVPTLAPGGQHTCELAADGTALCWGNNNQGQLGDGSTTRRPWAGSISGEQRFVAISAGRGHSCAVAVEGGAYCWGGNDLGQLGDGTLASRTQPVRVAGVNRVRLVESSNLHSCALTTAGEAWCWGSNAYGESGVAGGALARPTPVRVATTERFTTLALGWNHTCAITDEGVAVCWGQDTMGQLGDGDTAERRAPGPVDGAFRFVGLAAGSAHSCGVTSDGAAYCWGQNNFGQLGDGATVERSRPTRVAGGARFARVTAGSVHSCALTASGEAYCWGRNNYGQLGDGTTTDRSTPVRVSYREPFAALRASGAHTCATTASRRNVCWGYNIDGQLGDGTRNNRTRPVAVRAGG